jgi:hypothetical protein
MDFVIVCMNHVHLVSKIAGHVIILAAMGSAIQPLNRVVRVQAIVVRALTPVGMDIVIAQLNHAVHVQAIADHAMTLVGMEFVIAQLNHVVHAQAIVVIVLHPQIQCVAMEHVILEKIVEHVQTIVGPAVQRARRLTNMDLWKGVSVH